MRLTAEALVLFVLLVPGFVSSTVLSAIVVRQSKQRTSHVIIEALVFSLLIYTCLSPVFGGSPINLEIRTNEGGTTYLPNADPQFLISAIALAILLALIVGASITHDLHMKMLRWMRLTHRTARASTWIDIFVDQRRRYVEVTFADGRRLFGWPQYYSNHPGEGLLYLCQPAWIDGEKYVDLDVHGILLKYDERIESIVFTKPRVN